MNSQARLSQTKAPQERGVFIAFPTLACIFVLLRFYSRFVVVKCTSHDDWLIGVAMILSILSSACMMIQVHYGMGRHFETTTLDDGIGQLKGLFYSINAYNTSLTMTKLSILYQFLRISATKYHRRAVYGMAVFVILFGVTMLFVTVFMCKPISGFWDLRNTEAKCLDKTIIWFFHAGVNIFTDFALVIFPFFLLKALMMPMRQKITLILILALGGFASITSILRLHSLYVVTHSKDISWDNAEIAMWSCVELNVGIICASLPSLRALLCRYFPNMFNSFQPNSIGSYRLGSRANVDVTSSRSRDVYGSNSSRLRSSLGKNDVEVEVNELRDVQIHTPPEAYVHGAHVHTHVESQQVDPSGPTRSLFPSRSPSNAGMIESVPFGGITVTTETEQIFESTSGSTEELPVKHGRRESNGSDSVQNLMLPIQRA